MRPFIVAIHFDGVLAVYDQNRGVADIGRPVEGGKEFVRWLRQDLKCAVVVITTRRRTDVVERWLSANNIEVDGVNANARGGVEELSNQVIADLYIGTRYRQFTDYAALIPMVMGAQREHARRDPQLLDW